MTQRLTLAAAIVAMAALLSCSNGGNTGRPTNQSINPIEGLTTYVQSGEREGKAFFAAGDIHLVLNEKLALTGKTAAGEYANPGDASKLIAADFSLVKNSDGKEVWISNKMLVPGGTLGVVVSKTSIAYQKADLAMPTDSIIPRMTIVGVFPTPAENGFLQVTGWDEVHNKAISSVYVKATDLSQGSDDVQSSILFFKASKTTNPVVREQLLNNAAGLANSVFGTEIREALAEVAGSTEKAASGDNASATARVTENFDFAGIVNDNNVNVRSGPIESSAATGALQKGEKVTVIARTVDSYQIGGQNAQWFKVSKPQEGWVFGAFIDPAP